MAFVARARRAADRTLDQYERDLSVLCHLYPSKGLADLTDLELGAAVRRFPKASRRVRKAAFDSFYKWAVKTRRIEKNPMELLPSVKRRPQRYIDTFSEAEIEDLVALPLVDSVLMLLLVDAGLRKSEACALQVRRLKIDTGELVVVGGKGGKDRVVPMTSRLRQAVEELLLSSGSSRRRTCGTRASAAAGRAVRARSEPAASIAGGAAA
jgi:integrase/recombinase XerD